MKTNNDNRPLSHKIASQLINTTYPFFNNIYNNTDMGIDMENELITVYTVSMLSGEKGSFSFKDPELVSKVFKYFEYDTGYLISKNKMTVKEYEVLPLFDPE